MKGRCLLDWYVWEANIKIKFNENGVKVWFGFTRLGIWTSGGSCDQPSSFIKDKEYPVHPSDCAIWK